jgi:hypothetical protein
VITILRGPLRLRGGCSWYGASPQEDEFRPPQLIVGISIGYYGEKRYTDGIPIVPVILDTGLNKQFCISENHLRKIANIPLDRLAYDQRQTIKTYQGWTYKEYWATLWLHRTPYTAGDYMPPRRLPIFLGKSDKIRVFDDKLSPETGRQPCYPRLPTLGLHALMTNKLRLSVDGERSKFRLSRSVNAWLFADS